MPAIFSDANNMPSAGTIVSAAASVAASAMVIRSIARDLIPYELQPYVYSSIHRFFRSFSPEIVLIIEEYAGLGVNQIYKAADIYIGDKISPSTARFMVSMAEKESKITTSMARNRKKSLTSSRGCNSSGGKSQGSSNRRAASGIRILVKVQASRQRYVTLSYVSTRNTRNWSLNRTFLLFSRNLRM